MLILPKQKILSGTQDPRKLFIFAHTKTGKTCSALQLENNLVIDLESGTHYYDGMYVDVKKEAEQANINPLKVLSQIVSSLKKEKEDGFMYDYITIDTVTALQDMAESLATKMYKETVIGKSFKGDSVLTLPNGAGYGRLREAFQKIYNSFEGLYKKGMIFLGHVKLSSIVKDGESISVNDIQLTGKLKYMMCADVDAIGILYRSKSNTKNFITFAKGEENVSTGARCAHLNGKVIEFSNFDPSTGEVTTDRSAIYPSLLNKQKTNEGSNETITDVPTPQSS